MSAAARPGMQYSSPPADVAAAAVAGAGSGSSSGDGPAADGARAIVDLAAGAYEDTLPARELGGEAIWSISSAKPGNGVDQLRDGNLATYWQSDGTAPHIVTIQFLRNTSISILDFHVNFSLDESYTPKRVVVRAGSSVHDLVDVAAADVPQDSADADAPPPPSHVQIEATEDGGRWIRVLLASQDQDRPGPLRAHVLQLRIISMHQSGKDTHLRQVRVFGPRGTGYHGSVLTSSSSSLSSRAQQQQQGPGANVRLVPRSLAMAEFSFVR